MTDHPIAPSPELVQQWIGEYAAHHPELPEQVYIATHAAQWGADQELEACIAWFDKHIPGYELVADRLRAGRRPKPEELSHETAARNAVESCLAQREEVLEAFIAKHGFCPDEAIQVEQRLEDGSSTWRIELRAARRPKPLSLKEQALKAAHIELNPDGKNGALIIRALEALPND